MKQHNLMKKILFVLFHIVMAVSLSAQSPCDTAEICQLFRKYASYRLIHNFDQATSNASSETTKKIMNLDTDCFMAAIKDFHSKEYPYAQESLYGVFIRGKEEKGNVAEIQKLVELYMLNRPNYLPYINRSSYLTEKTKQMAFERLLPRLSQKEEIGSNIDLLSFMNDKEVIPYLQAKIDYAESEYYNKILPKYSTKPDTILDSVEYYEFQLDSVGYYHQYNTVPHKLIAPNEKLILANMGNEQYEQEWIAALREDGPCKASRYDNERYFKYLRTRKCIELLLEFLDTEDIDNRGCILRIKDNIKMYRVVIGVFRHRGYR